MKPWRVALLMLVVAATAAAQFRLSGAFAVHNVSNAKTDSAGVVVWLTPDSAAAHPPAPAEEFRMAQRGKKFVPALLVIPVGTTVAFPNFDPFFHNVFSLGDNHPFDLGLYQAGSSRSRTFSQPGVSYVFCNIHSQMSAVIVTVPTMWYAVSDAAGHFALPPVPAGDYHLHVWYARARPDDLAQLTRPLHLSADTELPAVTLEAIVLPATHKNKYGRDYDTTKAYGGG